MRQEYAIHKVLLITHSLLIAAALRQAGFHKVEARSRCAGSQSCSGFSGSVSCVSMSSLPCLIAASRELSVYLRLSNMLVRSTVLE